MKSNPDFPHNFFPSQRQTLFYDPATARAVLVTNKRGRMSHKVKRFSDAHTALDWCVARRVNFCYIATPDPKQN